VKPLSDEPVYSEADFADMQARWAQQVKEREYTTQLAHLAGVVSALPDQMRTIARQVAVEVLAEQRKDTESQRWTRAPVVANLFLLSAGTILNTVLLLVHH
jgi:hypothetical protein